MADSEVQSESAVDTTLEELAKLHAIDKELAKVQAQEKDKGKKNKKEIDQNQIEASTLKELKSKGGPTSKDQKRIESMVQQQIEQQVNQIEDSETF